MKKEDLISIIEKYLEGNTSEAEEYTLFQYAKEGAFPEAYKDVELMILSFQQAAEISMDEGKSENGKQKLRIFTINYWQSIAASVLLLALGFSAGLVSQNNNNSDQKIATIQSEVSQIKSLLMLEKMNHDSPSERMLAVYETATMDTINNAVLYALINKLHHDEDVNVRIAAAEALYKYGDRETVRQAFLKSLQIEEMPVLKIKIINLLVDLKEKKAIPELQKMVRQESTMPVLQQKAAEGISKLL